MNREPITGKTSPVAGRSVNHYYFPTLWEAQPARENHLNDTRTLGSAVVNVLI